jgi:hypothetical protein
MNIRIELPFSVWLTAIRMTASSSAATLPPPLAAEQLRGHNDGHPQ